MKCVQRVELEENVYEVSLKIIDSYYFEGGKFYCFDGEVNDLCCDGYPVYFGYDELGGIITSFAMRQCGGCEREVTYFDLDKVVEEVLDEQWLFRDVALVKGGE